MRWVEIVPSGKMPNVDWSDNPDCAAELRSATRIDQAVYCEEPSVEGSNFCTEHKEFFDNAIQDGCECDAHNDPEHDIYCSCCT